MAVAILTTVFAETSGRRLLRRPLPVRPQDGKDRTGQFLFVPEINYLLRVTLRNVSAERGIFACRQYGFVPDTQQWDECMKYVGSKRPPLLRP